MSDHTEATLTNAILQTWSFTAGHPRYIVGIQVNNGAGFRFNRTLDAIVFDTWPSSGLPIHGLEIKTTRVDLRRELQNTTKFADFADYLDHFSIVAPPGIAKLTMLPEHWGLYCPDTNGKLRARRKPLMLHDKGKRREMNRSFAAAFMRALVNRTIDKAAHEAEYDRGFTAGVADGKRRARQADSDRERIKASLETFEEVSGVRVSDWDGKRIGEAVDFVLKGGLNDRARWSPNIRELGTRLIDLADELDRLNEQLKVERIP